MVGDRTIDCDRARKTERTTLEERAITCERTTACDLNINRHPFTS
jgi:hypothetical protein